MATSSELRHAGIHWSENAGGEHPSAEKIALMPGMRGAFLVCSPSARWHWETVTHVNRDAAKVWRGIPEQGRLPAQLGWNAGKVADACLLHYDEQVHVNGEWFLPLNELQFEREAGAPFPGYGVVAGHLGALRQVLRSRQPSSLGGLMFPAWGPSDDMDHLDEWRAEAALWDALAIHCYGSAGTMYERYLSYRDAFPNVLLFVGEWNANHEGHDERAALQMWADVAAKDPYFLGATYYIWETNNEGEHDLSIWGNPDRLALFSDPPLAAIEPPPVVEPEPPPPEPEPPMPDYPLGVDVASYQGYPDWNAVAGAGYAFAFTKVTEDTGYTNPTFAHNWAGIKAAGMIRGAYHFARPGAQDAVAEADWFLNQVDVHGGLEEGDLLALDLESGSGDLGQWALDFLHRCEARCGFKPLVYSGTWFTEPHNLGYYPELATYGLWLAAYQSSMPAAPAPWAFVAFWQHSSSGQVPGIAGDVDLNVFNGPADHIRLYGKPAAEPQPEPVPSPYSVGSGILAKMAEMGDTPASNELYVASDWSEAFGTSGARYVWVLSLGRALRFDPAA